MTFFRLTVAFTTLLEESARAQDFTHGSTLAPGVVLYKVSTPASAYVVTVDLSTGNYEIRVVGDRIPSTTHFYTQTVENLGWEYHAIAALNGYQWEPFGHEGVFAGANVHYDYSLVMDHEVLADHHGPEAVVSFGEVAAVLPTMFIDRPADSTPLPSFYYAVGSATSVVRNGLCSNPDFGNGMARSAVGFSAQEAVLISTDQATSDADISDLCTIFMARGVQSAVYLDGGSASALAAWANGVVLSPDGLALDGSNVNPIVNAVDLLIYGTDRHVASAIAVVPVREYDCANGADDDFDHEVDCNDTDCSADARCGNCATSTDCPARSCQVASCESSRCSYSPVSCGDGMVCDAVLGCVSDAPGCGGQLDGYWCGQSLPDYLGDADDRVLCGSGHVISIEHCNYGCDPQGYQINDVCRPPPEETCNGADDDGDLVVDNGFACAFGTSQPCTSPCGAGEQACAVDCSGWDACSAPAQVQCTDPATGAVYLDCSCPPATETCTGAQTDDDGDGLWGCQDPDCFSAPICASPDMIQCYGASSYPWVFDDIGNPLYIWDVCDLGEHCENTSQTTAICTPDCLPHASEDCVANNVISFDSCGASEGTLLTCSPQELCVDDGATAHCEAIACDVDGDGQDSTACGGLDCDDANAAVHHSAPELCDGIDNNCDGSIDEGPNCTDFDHDGWSDADDCYPTEALAYPGAAENPDRVDNDCDGVVDEIDCTTDFDLFVASIDVSDPNTWGAAIDAMACPIIPGYEIGGTLQLTTSSFGPYSWLSGNGLQPIVSDTWTDPTIVGIEFWGDWGDGTVRPAGLNDIANTLAYYQGTWAVPSVVVSSDSPSGFAYAVGDPICADADGDGFSAVPCGLDCNDADPRVSPDVPETCDGIDNNCDGASDEGCGDIDGDGIIDNDDLVHDHPGTRVLCVADRAFPAGDLGPYGPAGYGFPSWVFDPNYTAFVDPLHAGFTCYDFQPFSEYTVTWASLSGNYADIANFCCSYIDPYCYQDGLGTVGFRFASVSELYPTVNDECPADSDGDGAFTPGDCDDRDATVYPGAPESCDGIDSDCDGVDCGFLDSDGDGLEDAIDQLTIRNITDLCLRRDTFAPQDPGPFAFVGDAFGWAYDPANRAVDDGTWLCRPFTADGTFRVTVVSASGAWSNYGSYCWDYRDPLCYYNDWLDGMLNGSDTSHAVQVQVSAGIPAPTVGDERPY